MIFDENEEMCMNELVNDENESERVVNDKYEVMK